MIVLNTDNNKKFPLIVIGKSASLCCFSGIKILPVNYTFIKNAWINKSVFRKWLLDLDFKFSKRKRKICLIIIIAIHYLHVKG